MELIERLNKINAEYSVFSNKISFDNNIILEIQLKINNFIEVYEIICENITRHSIVTINNDMINFEHNKKHGIWLENITETYSIKLIEYKPFYSKIFKEFKKIHKEYFKFSIPFEKYFIKNKISKELKYYKIYEGPKFIADKFIKILETNGIKYYFEKIPEQIKSGNQQMFHFGDSYIIAEKIYDKIISRGRNSS
ncbi:MAG: hypothetical protein LBI28_13045 [Treponema sp.]|jgi:hypothetical protein|nr:hypothetical protein [Treponema sp.]